MKNSIGSLAALAAFALPAVVEAAPEVASFSNVPLPTVGSVAFDFDSNGTTDFYVFSNSLFVRLVAEGDTLFTDSLQSFGSIVSTGSPTASFPIVEPAEGTLFGVGYYGLSFEREGQTHTGWLLLDFTGDPKLAVSGAWEANAGQSISVGAIPEPSAAAALGGAGVLAFAVLRRRRKPVAPSS